MVLSKVLLPATGPPETTAAPRTAAALQASNKDDDDFRPRFPRFPQYY